MSSTEKRKKITIPTPFVITVGLTLCTLILALGFTRPAETPVTNYFGQLLVFWQKGLWNPSLLVFAYQMMLILVLGHALVLSPPIQRYIHKLGYLCRNATLAVMLVASLSMLLAFFNWGLSLIFSALFARALAETAAKEKLPINYPLIGAAAYLGLMVWHGGISGSAPSKITESGHLRNLVMQQTSMDMNQIPDHISYAETIFSSANLWTFVSVFIAVLVLFYYLSKSQKVEVPDEAKYGFEPKSPADVSVTKHRIWGRLFALMLFAAFFLSYGDAIRNLNLSPNLINLFLLASALFLHGDLMHFMRAIYAAIGDIADILIQFPLYFAIMGVMQDSGLVHFFSQGLIALADTSSLPIFVYLSASVVNLFVPSGGGQWVLQGPIILEAAHALHVPFNKVIMAMAYGDQISNMLQPFWALPLLGITRLRASQILKYSVLSFIVGFVIFIISLYSFW